MFFEKNKKEFEKEFERKFQKEFEKEFGKEFGFKPKEKHLDKKTVNNLKVRLEIQDPMIDNLGKPRPGLVKVSIKNLFGKELFTCSGAYHLKFQIIASAEKKIKDEGWILENKE